LENSEKLDRWEIGITPAVAGRSGIAFHPFISR